MLVRNKSPISLGYTLIELMIAITLSTFLMAGVITIFVDSKQTDNVAEALARIQETGRTALDILTKDTRMAGYQGCADPETLEMNIIANNPPTNSFLTTAVRGWEVTSTTWAAGTEISGTEVESSARIGSDVIAIQRGVSGDTELVGNMAADNANIQVNNNNMGFAKNDIVIISDCESADMFRISSNPDSNTWAHANNVNSSNRLSQLYDDEANIFSFKSIIYFVADTGRKNAAGDAINALYQARDFLNDSATTSFEIQELLEGVDSLQLLYGELLATGNMAFKTANNVTDMQRVTAVKLGILVSSTTLSRSSNDSNTYNLPGQSIAAQATPANGREHKEDRRLRRDFTTTIAIRNRL
ncbi:MAG: PilW family protein [Pseudomonadales bacterium]|nr:PilW family protein [Pseudomonadales bacterium]